MIWRKFQLDLSYAIGELLIVVIGVLIALAIDQWNGERLERLQEVGSVTRIIIDLETDLEDIDFRLRAVDAKEASLLRVKAVFAGDTRYDPAEFLKDIVVGADFGWNQGVAQRSTYDNLLGSGKLGIIADSDIRTHISNYYRTYLDEHNRIDARESSYPDLSYHLIPRRSNNISIVGGALEREIESGLTEAELNALVELVMASSIRDQVTAEINLARFIRDVEQVIQYRAVSLADLLKKYRARFQ